MSDLSDRAWMTPLLNRIADIAGVRAAILLGTEKACRKIKIPKAVTADHWLAELVGLEAAQKLAEAFGGEHIVIPPVLVGSKRRRAQAIAKLNDEGLSLSAVAVMVGVARSTVIDHRSKRAKSPKPKIDGQGSLL